ncbi:iron ABC transporter permease [Desulfurella acetivorans A63]|nr:iron ABC transporter permease [Desulfurella acetivorans A63]
MIAKTYLKQKRIKLFYLLALVIILFVLIFASVMIGSYNISVYECLKALVFKANSNSELVIWQMRLPQALTASLAGGGLALCGAVLQVVLKNPLASPFTLGISSSSAFGAALAIFFGSAFLKNPYAVSFSAFLSSLIATFIIVFISKLKNASNETLILSGVAIGSLFSALLAILQYFSSDTQISAIIFWMFGDCSRASYHEIFVIFVLYILSFLFFLKNSIDYKLLLFGDDQAKSLGVNVENLRLTSMVIASLLSASIVAFVGIIGFVGLIAPQVAKRIMGLDYFLISSSITGSIFLVGADLLAKNVLQNVVLPVGIVTSFIGAPAFFYLIIRGKK